MNKELQSKNVKELIEYIEKKYDVESVKVDGIQLWPFYKIFLFDLIYVPNGTKVSLTRGQKLNLIKSIYYGWTNLFKPFDYIGFSNSDQRKLLEGKMVDKSIDYVMEQLPKSWLIELPVFEHYASSQIPTKSITSFLPFRIVETILQKTTLKNVKVENEHILTSICEELGVHVDPVSVGRRLVSQVKVMNYLLNWKKPKGIFMVVPYMKMGYVYAANKKRVPVVEMQHGVINQNHFPYFHEKTFDSNLFPEKLISYGTKEQEFFDGGSTVYNKNAVVPGGHYYLDSIVDSNAQQTIRKRLSKYTYSIAFSLQDDAIGSRLPEFIKGIADKLPEVGFLLCPRKKAPSYYDQFNLPENVVVNDTGTIYDAIKATQAHSTVFSTCALEAPALGRRNLMIDLEGKSKEYFGEVLLEGEVNIYVSEQDECIAAIQQMVKDSIEEQVIKEENKVNIVPDYKQNIKRFLSQF